MRSAKIGEVAIFRVRVHVPAVETNVNPMSCMSALRLTLPFFLWVLTKSDFVRKIWSKARCCVVICVSFNTLSQRERVGKMNTDVHTGTMT